ncbi:hypothetical protein OsJ_31726 [Oryza sativa Japonica Group]|uniref:Uncharacterized protein n=1 Tax=Oryza sativa subsp. japonica TaxID=39947 RepID=A3C5A4_ORYSJ|nr:hypothetical protein OsJ_31726 [Oryza sativa Japonica Group]
MASPSPPIAAPGIEFTAPPPGRDHTQDCSLTYAQWKEVDASTRHRLSLDARAALGYTAQRIFARFMAITKLTLRYAQGSGTDSLSDDGARPCGRRAAVRMVRQAQAPRPPAALRRRDCVARWGHAGDP